MPSMVHINKIIRRALLQQKETTSGGSLVFSLLTMVEGCPKYEGDIQVWCPLRARGRKKSGFLVGQMGGMSSLYTVFPSIFQLVASKNRKVHECFGAEGGTGVPFLEGYRQVTYGQMPRYRN